MTAHNHDNATDKGLEIAISFVWNGVNLIVTNTFFTATRRWKVVGIRGRVTTSATVATPTFILYRAPSGTAIASGTTLHTGTFDLVGTPDTNQTLTLAAAANLEVAVGNSIGLALTGTATTAAGTVTVTLVPN